MVYISIYVSICIPKDLKIELNSYFKMCNMKWSIWSILNSFIFIIIIKFTEARIPY